MGMAWTFGGLGVLVEALIAGTLADSQHVDFVPAQAFAGVTMATDLLCLIAPLVAVVIYNGG